MQQRSHMTSADRVNNKETERKYKGNCLQTHEKMIKKLEGSGRHNLLSAIFSLSQLDLEIWFLLYAGFGYRSTNQACDKILTVQKPGSRWELEVSWESVRLQLFGLAVLLASDVTVRRFSQGLRVWKLGKGCLYLEGCWFESLHQLGTSGKACERAPDDSAGVEIIFLYRKYFHFILYLLFDLYFLCVHFIFPLMLLLCNKAHSLFVKTIKLIVILSNCQAHKGADADFLTL